MTDKRCLIYETLGKVTNLQVSEAAAPQGMMRLEGVFGVCGIKNQNNRVYDKENYGKMVESLQEVIKTTGCPGELEHPNSMNINLENVSHKIEDIQMNEDGTITGTILLLNTPKGQIAQAIVEGGLPLYISSRGAGTITNEGKVTLSTIKTYDLVGTPGFSQAKLTLKQNQTLECLNESANEGNEIWAVVEGVDELDNSSDQGKTSEPKKDDSNKNDNNKNNDDKKVNMNELKEAIDKLSEKVESLEAQLHVAQESLNEVKTIQPTNYDAIQKWVTEEFWPNYKDQIQIPESVTTEEIEDMISNKISETMDTMAEGIQNWVVEEFAPEVQNWVVEEFAPEVQNWVVEEFAPEVQNWIVEEYSPEVQGWITEEFAPEVQGWITEEFAPEVQGWITEEFAPVIEGWITEEFAPEQSKAIEDKVNENVSAFMESQNAGRLDEIDNILESIAQDQNSDINKIIAEQNNTNKYKGIYVVESMPAEYKPSWELLTEARQQEIIRSSKMYDFTKEGVLESFWANVNFSKDEPKQVNENHNDPVNSYQNNIVARMKALRGLNV